MPVGDGKKFLNKVDLCILEQLVAQPTHLHCHILDLNLSPSGLESNFGVNISEVAIHSGCAGWPYLLYGYSRREGAESQRTC